MSAQSLIRKLESVAVPLGAFHARPMFGGHGLYLDGLMFGLIAYDRLYLKTDTVSRPRFEAAKSTPFSYEARGRPVVITSYWLCPPAALKEAERLRGWIETAREAARRSKAKKPARKTRRRNPAAV
jgi:DNA transformation protein